MGDNIKGEETDALDLPTAPLVELASLAAFSGDFLKIQRMEKLLKGIAEGVEAGTVSIGKSPENEFGQMYGRVPRYRR